MNWQHARHLRDSEADWLVRAVLAGFVATALMSGVFAVAYGLALVLGSASPQAPILQRWVWGLANNSVTAHAQTAVPIAVMLHVFAGIAWAVVYARFAEPRLSGPGWRRGLLFAPIPGILSLVVFVPALGGGLFGLGLGAGPLPIVGNIVLHLVYGATLGSLYRLESSKQVLTEGGVAESWEDRWEMVHTANATVAGIIVGFAFGGLAGWLSAIALNPSQPALVGLMLGALLGSAAGALVGSFSGLTESHT